MVMAANVIGGHEFQARALADDVAKLCKLTIFLNRKEHLSVFESVDAEIEVHSGLFLTEGWLGKQVWRGIQRRNSIRELLNCFEHIFVCGGTVEAGVCTSIALAGSKKAILYLPSFHDRTVVWGVPVVGCVYNLVLGWFGMFYKHIITVNRIQAFLLRRYLHRPTSVVPNIIQNLPRVAGDSVGRVLCICRLDHNKRLPELLRWLDFPENPFREVVIIGDGPEKHSIERLSKLLQNLHVTLLGWKSTSDQNNLICAHDVLILNSLIEGEPLVIREANKRGILVVARDIPGVRGITWKANRFDSRSTLHQLLQSANGGILKVRPERSEDEVAQRRILELRAILTHRD